MKKVVFNAIIYIVDDRLDEYEIHKRPSSNIDFFGVDLQGERFFVQFNNGTCYLFSEVPSAILNDAVNAESIGKFFNTNIARKYPSVKVEKRLVIEEVAA